jgi:iron complex outermembrane recepter protein
MRGQPLWLSVALVWGWVAVGRTVAWGQDLPENVPVEQPSEPADPRTTSEPSATSGTSEGPSESASPSDGVSPSESETPAASTAQVEDIVVTAERRKENLQDTPISITALNQRALRERSMTDLGNLAYAVPNLQLTTAGQGSGGGNFAQIFIRGVGQGDFNLTKDPAVGVYVDGVYLARAPGALLELLDIERIEVLRGPQGTLFGKNTAGGAISVITKQPEGNFTGVAELRAGTYGRTEISGSFETPVIPDQLALRVSGISRRQDGYYERLLAAPNDHRTVDGNGVGTHSGRLTLSFTPSDELTITVAGDGTLERHTGTDYQAVNIFADAPNIELYNRVVLAPMGQRYDSAYVAPRPWTTYSTTPSFNNADIWGVSGTLNWELGPLTLKSITAFRDLNVATRTDGDGTPFDVVASDGIVVDQSQFSQELQATGTLFEDRLDWVVGLWYFTEHAEEEQVAKQLVGLFEALEAAPPGSIAPPPMAPGMPPPTCPAPPGTMPDPCLGGPGNMNNLRYEQTRHRYRTLDGRSYAAFAHLSFRLIDQLSFTAGGRYSREEKDFTYTEVRPLQNNRRTIDNAQATPAWNVFSPKLGVEFRATDDLMAYGSWARGFKAGGVNGRATRTDLFTSFDPEELTTYEVGVKSDWFERKLRFNLAGFFSRYADIQILRNTVDAQGAFIAIEENAGDANIIGFEAEVSAAPVKGLTLSAGAGYTHFEFTSLLPQMAPPGTPSITLDNQLPYTPEFVANVSTAYTLSLGAAGQISVRADFGYSTSYFTDIDNVLEVQQPSYFWLNARAGYGPSDGSWEVFAAGTNLTDQAVIATSVAARATGSQVVSYKPPRLLYAGIRFAFD